MPTKKPVKKTTKNEAKPKTEAKKNAVEFRIEWLLIAFFVLLFIISTITLGFRKNPFSTDKVVFLPTKDINTVKEIVKNYVDKTLLQGQATSTISSIKEDAGTNQYEVKLTVQGTEYTMYATLDGSYLYRLRYDMAAATNPATDATKPQEFSTKSDKPVVQLYTMSYCPYGNTAEDMVKPVYDLLSSKIDFEPHYIIYSDYAKNAGASWKTYCTDSSEKYCSMHGIQELHQNVRELCVWQGQKAQYWDFVMAANSDCTSSNVDTCWESAAKKTEVDVTAVKSCVSSQTNTLLASELALNAKNNVQSSPTIIVNGAQYSGSRVPETFKQSLCTAFNSSPSECAQELSSTASTTTGSCN